MGGTNPTYHVSENATNHSVNKHYRGIPDDRQIAFEIRMDGDPVGEHRLIFSEHADGLQVDIEIKITVRLGPIPVYRYTHKNTEIWNNDTLIKMDSHTYDNGETYDVSVTQAGDNPDTLDIRASNGVYYSTPLGALATTYWNRQTVKQDQLINSQDGRLIDINTVVVKQTDQITTYHMTGPDRFDVNVTYDNQTNEWVGLSFTRKRRDFTYHRIK